jgi:membrane fusion protein (multidrug efflux system)
MEVENTTTPKEPAKAITTEQAKPQVSPMIKRNWLSLVVPGFVFLLAAILFLTITGKWDNWTAGAPKQTTDDAYLHADLTPLSTKVSGVVAKVNVSDYQHVKKGELLVQLKDDDFQAQVAQAEAGVAQANAAIEDNRRQEQLQATKIGRALAGVDQAKAGILAAQAHIDAAQAALGGTLPERRRQEALISTGSTTPQKLEQAVAGEEGSRAQLAASQASLQESNAALLSSEAAVEAERRGLLVLNSSEAQLAASLAGHKAALAAARSSLDYTRISAPTDGVVGERKVRPGQMVNPGTQVISLVEDDVWVLANYRETQLRHVEVGNAAEINVDAFPGIVLRGKVTSLSPASGSQFALLAPDNATGNFTKVTQRIPVKITLDPDSRVSGKLRPGMSVIATIYASAR